VQHGRPSFTTLGLKAKDFTYADSSFLMTHNGAMAMIPFDMVGKPFVKVLQRGRGAVPFAMPLLILNRPGERLCGRACVSFCTSLAQAPDVPVGREAQDHGTLGFASKEAEFQRRRKLVLLMEMDK